ncbi:MAG: molybdopterin-dependent oxidoreductase, partial [Candidatus Marinimicrobia bacterium]|nr:molybdopterin-dependent oxidoreductase [Candidatus Neomarinimicrobiota bacterium]
MARKIVHVIGTGTTAEPLIGLLSDYRDQLGIDDVTFLKNTPLTYDRSKVKDLIRRGARLVTTSDAMDGFKSIGLDPDHTAEEALELIDVEYEELPAVYDPEEAMKDGAPQIHDKTTSPYMYDENHNISLFQQDGHGDMDKGWAEADYIREDRFVTGAQAHAPLGPHSALASF